MQVSSSRALKDHAGDTFKLFFVQSHTTAAGTNSTDVYAADATP